MSLDAILDQARVLPQLVSNIGDDFVNRNLQDVFGLLLLNLPDLDHAKLGGLGRRLFDHDGAGRVHPVERLV